MKLSEKISKGEAGLLGYFVGGTILIALIIFGIYAFTAVRNYEPSATTDKASGEKVIEANTGAIGDDIALIGFDALLDKGIKGQVYLGVTGTIKDFFTLSQPNRSSLSYVANSLNYDSENYEYVFKARLDNGDEFEIRANGIDETDYQVKISQSGDVLLDYDSSREALVTKSAGVLWKELPFTFKLSDGTRGQFVYKQDDEGNKAYYISVNTCGDENLQQEARTKVYSFLERNNFDPAEISINFPNTCDGEAHGE